MTGAIAAIRAASARAEKLLATRDAPPPRGFRVPRVKREDEDKLDPSLQSELKTMRDRAAMQGIAADLVFVHEDTLTGGPAAGDIWVCSKDVPRFKPKVIPRAITDGRARPDEFAEALYINTKTPLVPLQCTEFDVLQYIYDMEDSVDANMLAYALEGAPQAYCGPLRTFMHKNHPLRNDVRKKMKQKMRDEQAEGRYSEELTEDELREKFPAAYRSAPLGAVPHNSYAKWRIAQGMDARYRPIFDASMPDSHGISVNSQSTYETMHKVLFARFQDFETQILDAVKRLKELGLHDWANRILVWKNDIKAAYRKIRIHPPDQWLTLFGIEDDEHSTLTKWVIDMCQAFGQRRAVTIFSRWAYSFTSFFSVPGWDQKWFPKMSIPYQAGEMEADTLPTAAELHDRLEPFRRGPDSVHGIISPLVFFRGSFYLDDGTFVAIDIRDDISTPLSACSATGIRHPTGKAVSSQLRRWKIKEELKKRKKENGDVLMGSKTPDILGLRVDLANLRVYLRDEYKSELVTMMDEFIQKGETHTAIPKKAWDTITGKLGFAIVVYTHAKCLMRENWDMCAAMERHSNKFRRAGNIVIENMHTLRQIVDRNAGRSLHHSKAHRSNLQKGLEFSDDPSFHDALSDASTGHGFGFVNTRTGEYFFRPWNKEETGFNIYVLEAVGTYFMFRCNIHHVHHPRKQSRIRLWGDNEGLARAFKSVDSKGSRMVNALIRKMVIDLSNLDITMGCDTSQFDTAWCNTTEMGPYGDALSRNDEDTFLRHFCKHHPDVTPNRLPNNHPHILQAEADWLHVRTHYPSGRPTSK
jgi:hypothetical protein